MVGASGARYFDGEGVATKRMPVFENGVLKTYYIDTYSANKMDMKQTIASPSILTMQMGNRDADGLIASVDKGIRQQQQYDRRLLLRCGRFPNRKRLPDTAHLRNECNRQHDFFVEQPGRSRQRPAHVLQLACSFVIIRRSGF